MLKAVVDFEYASVKVKAGEVIPPYTFEADEIPTLVSRGWVEVVKGKLTTTKGKKP